MLKRTKKPLLAIVLTLALCFGVFTPMTALATGPGPIDPTDVSEAAITKLLEVPFGTEVPATMSFEFEIDKVSLNGGTATADLADMPSYQTVTIDFDGSQTKDATLSTGGLDVWYIESGSLFDAGDFPYAGIFTYLITETAGTYTDSVSDPTEKTTYSEAEYEISIYVREYAVGDTIPAGKSAGDLYIYAIGAFKLTEDPGDGSTVKVKIDPTPGGDGGTTTDYSQMIFINSYVKTNDGTDPEDPDDWTLSVSKTVDVGTEGLGSVNKYFDYEMTVTQPTVLVTTAPLVWKAYILDSSGDALADLTDNGVTASGSDGFGEYLNVTSGAMFEFSLKHGERLVFIDTPVGTTYAIEEAGAASYVPSVEVVYDSTTSGTDSDVSGSPLEIPSAAILTALGHDDLYVSEEGTSADFTNTFDTTPPAGLNISNLSFYILILVGAVGFGLFMFIKNRRKNSYNV